jgi:hypothetical protein
VLILAIGGLAVSALLAAGSILSFSWSVTASKAMLPGALVTAGLGALGVSGAAAQAQSGLAAWAFLFACASCGCSLNAIRKLYFRPIRWIHRFTIYSGYGATFAAMGVVALELRVRGVSGWWAAAALIGSYTISSAGILLAKTLTARRAVSMMPEYQASLGASGDDQGYW